MTGHPLTLACIAVAGVGVALSATALVAMFGDAPEIPMRGRLLFWAWLSAPYTGILVTALLFRTGHSTALAVLTGAVLSVAYAALGLFAVVRSTSSTAGMGILILPLVQWFGVLAAAVIAAGGGGW